MIDFESTPLWQQTLARRVDDPFERQREKLRSAYLQFREAVEPMANDIAVSMPMFTDHSINHVDSLWETASQLTGSDYPLNPAEAFVLGGAFLLHDLGMGLVAYADLQKIHDDPKFQDIRTSLQAEPHSLSESVAGDLALVQYLRLRHARQAEELLVREFSAPPRSFYLLQDATLRSAYGSTIGKVAHSHWFDISALQVEFDVKLGSIPEYPSEWTVDPLKIACLLRLADAVHIDSRRAPMYLHAYRKPTGVSHNHWYFQERLTRPIVVNDRLEYTATSAFGPSEAAAWWLSFDTVKLINRELQQVDALCADVDLPRFAVRSVAGAESPDRFSRYVKTDSWTPIDASLRVSQVTSVIESLGGPALYGKKPAIALRELISNAADATRARKVQFGGSDLAITVKLTKSESNWVLSIRDRGLGMSPAQLVAYLTDFGTSYWTAADRIDEYPGLLSRGYKSTGKFGIGFFAAFMLADSVEVSSLKYRGASEHTHVLAFPDGLKSRPLLRRAVESEQLDTGGTEVRLVLKKPPLSDGGLFDVEVSKFSMDELLRQELVELCGLLDVDLLLQVDNGPVVTAVLADEWKTMPAPDLYSRLYFNAETTDPAKVAMHEAYSKVFSENLEDIFDESGDIIGRAALAAGLDELVSSDLWWWPSHTAQVYVGGMATDHIWDVMGVFVGEPTTASRNSAFPVASPTTLRAWAENQANKARENKFSTPMGRYGAARLARSVGAVARDLPCGFVSDQMITPAGLYSWVQHKDAVALVSDSQVWVYYDEERGIVVADYVKHQLLSLPENVIIAEGYSSWLFPDEVLKEPVDERFTEHVKQNATGWDPAWWWHKHGSRGTSHLLLEACAAAWDTDPVLLGLGMESLDYTTERGDQRMQIPRADGSGTLPLHAYLIRRPPQDS